MKLNTGINSAFPSQMVSEEEKKSLEYGLLVGQAIEYEWFRGGRVNGSRWNTGYQNFHNLRLYARGEQNVQKYKDELSINGDLSYLNLDWKPVPIIPKFVNIVVNGIFLNIISNMSNQPIPGWPAPSNYHMTLIIYIYIHIYIYIYIYGLRG